MNTYQKYSDYYLKSYHSKTIDETEAIYNQWAKKYDEDMENLSWQAPLQIAQLLHTVLWKNKNVKIIDVGAGTGQAGVCLKNLGFTHIDAMDISEHMLSFAKNRQIYSKVIKGNAEEIHKHIEEKYDVLVCIGALNFGHISSHALVEFVNVVNKDGFICFSTRDEFYEQSSKPIQEKLCAENKWELVEQKKQTASISDSIHWHWLYRVTA